MKLRQDFLRLDIPNRGFHARDLKNNTNFDIIKVIITIVFSAV